jgi:hypothetical protein
VQNNITKQTIEVRAYFWNRAIELRPMTITKCLGVSARSDCLVLRGALHC